MFYLSVRHSLKSNILAYFEYPANFFYKKCPKLPHSTVICVFSSQILNFLVYKKALLDSQNLRTQYATHSKEVVKGATTECSFFYKLACFLILTIINIQSQRMRLRAKIHSKFQLFFTLQSIIPLADTLTEIFDCVQKKRNFYNTL